MSNTLVWFRNDARIADNPALHEACKTNGRVSAVFFDASEQWQSHHLSQRRLSFTENALNQLELELAKLGIDFKRVAIRRFSDIPNKLKNFCVKNKVDRVVFNLEYGVDEQQRDAGVVAALKKNKIETQTFHANIIIPPGSIKTGQGQPYKVFTAFKRAWLKQFPQHWRQPYRKPKPRDFSSAGPSKIKNTLNKTANSLWPASEKEAQQRLRHFTNQLLNQYEEQRDIPSLSGTSSLSPYLTVGLISPHACMHAALAMNNGELSSGDLGAQTWINELIWREFYLHLMHAFPEVCKHKPLRPETDRVPWRYDESEFLLWREGKTGFPLVDAAMHQLHTTGWMHNRLRMVTATFLTKYLLIDWRWGERYFMEQLIDGHFASNNGGWQWCASTGTDAAPYFRILSPIRQAERFDPDTTFIKQMLPELELLPAKTIHKPGHPDLLATGYPEPMIDLNEGKERCLEAFRFAKT